MSTLLIWPSGMRGNSLFPLGLGYLQNSVGCSILNCAIDDISHEQLTNIVSGYKLIGISTWGFNLKNVQSTIELIRKNTDATIIAGGPTAHLAKADYMILGEAEISFKLFVTKFMAGDFESLVKLPGVGNQYSVPQFPTIFNGNLDDLGLIDYEKLQLDKYLSSGYLYRMFSLKGDFRSAPIIATRGCPYRCKFCTASLLMGRKVRKHSVDYILSTIDLLYKKHSVEQISFLDDNLTFDMDYAKSLCEAIIKMKERRGYRFILTTSNGVRVNRLDEELLRLMKRAGWCEIVIAPESGSPNTLKRMRKDIDLVDVNDKVEMIHRHRMNAVGIFMYGYPGETKADLMLTQEYIMNSKFDRVLLSYFTPYPGTPIYDDLVNAGEIDSDFCFRSKTKGSMTDGYITENLTKDDLLEFEKSVYSKTVFREKWIEAL